MEVLPVRELEYEDQNWTVSRECFQIKMVGGVFVYYSHWRGAIFQKGDVTSQEMTHPRIRTRQW